jgi:L-fucose mutarotase
MLKGIPSILSPDLLKYLMEMGHNDEIVIADGNFPAASKARRIIRADGHDVVVLLNAILKFFPLDEKGISIGALMKTNDGSKPPIWDKFYEELKKGKYKKQLEMLTPNEFYDRAEKAYCVIATSETALYANILLRKGVV